MTIFFEKYRLYLPLDAKHKLQYFADGDDNPDGGGEQQEQQDQQQQQGEQKDSKSFTQEDVNNLIAKEKKAAQEKFLKDAGFTDFKNLKDGMEQFKQWQDSQKTEQQKQAEALEAATKTLEQEKAEKATLAAKLAAVTAGAKADTLDDVILLAQPKVSDEVTIEQAIADVLEKYPHFKGGTEQEEKQPAPQFTPGSPTPPGNGTMTREQFVKMNYNDRVKFQKENPTVFKNLFG